MEVISIHLLLWFYLMELLIRHRPLFIIWKIINQFWFGFLLLAIEEPMGQPKSHLRRSCNWFDFSCCFFYFLQWRILCKERGRWNYKYKLGWVSATIKGLAKEVVLPTNLRRVWYNKTSTLGTLICKRFQYGLVVGETGGKEVSDFAGD